LEPESYQRAPIDKHGYSVFASLNSRPGGRLFRPQSNLTLKQRDIRAMHTSLPTIYYRTAKVQGLDIAYREAGNAESPKLVLLHGFPSSSHQYRDLIAALAPTFHVIAPDYLGFGNSSIPDPASYTYSFDGIADIISEFLAAKGFDRFGLYVQDYGGPVGFRITGKDPNKLEWLIIQNSNAYEVGFTAAWDGFRNALWKNRNEETEKPLTAFLQEAVIKSIYLHGAKEPERISPDNWISDSHFMERPNARRVQLDLFYDYRKNVELYPKWQAFLRRHQPKTIIFWGQDDIFFTRKGGEAFLKDLPNAQMHRLEAGHFAVEDSLTTIVDGMIHFYNDNVAGKKA
jgi:pimeloyl-ACP methyl ester carboxylesterase